MSLKRKELRGGLSPVEARKRPQKGSVPQGSPLEVYKNVGPLLKETSHFSIKMQKSRL